MPGMKQKIQVNTNFNVNVKAKGFSLLELTFVLGIVGVLSVGSVLVYSEQSTHAKWQESQQKLKVAKKAILKFAEVNKYMPCPDITGTGVDSRTTTQGSIPAIPATPATPAIPKTTTAPTIPAIPSTGAQAAIPNIDVSTCSANNGTVPYEAIGLSRADVQDSWGNLFHYAVDQGVTNADAMLNCPTDTACFFNGDPKPVLPSGKILPGSVLPAFDLTTQPLKGSLGVNNLRICADAACSTVQAEGLVAVLIAYNENGPITSGLSSSEAENKDFDVSFVNAAYSESPYYDDLILGIAANEIKTRHEKEAVEVVIGSSSSGPTIITGTNFVGGGADKTIGDIGDNNPYSDNVQTAVAAETLSFGAENAGKTVVMTLDTLAYGTWDQPWGTDTGLTSDSAFVSVNGNIEKTIKYWADNETATSGDGSVDNDFTYNGYYSYYDPASWDADGVYTEGETNRTEKSWTDSHEVIFVLDDSGNANLEFAVATTGTDEQVDFTNVELILYDTPPAVPDFPSVSAIDGIPETEGL